MQTPIANRRSNIGQVVSNSEAVEVGLSDGELFAMSGDRRGTRLESLEGGFWVTQSGDPEDHWLRPGQTFVISRKGKVVVMGMPQGMLRVM
jgi:hypothetical protein